MELPAIDEVEAHQHGCQNEDHRQTGVGHKVQEAEPGGTADHDVGGVADEGGGAADVGGHDLGDEEGDRAGLQHVGDGQGHGADEEHRGDVVQKPGEHRCDDTQQEHQGPGPALGDLGCLDGNVFKDAGVLDDRYEKHHTDENADGIDVHIGEAGLHRENACENEQ